MTPFPVSKQELGGTSYIKEGHAPIVKALFLTIFTIRSLLSKNKDQLRSLLAILPDKAWIIHLLHPSYTGICTIEGLLSYEADIFFVDLVWLSKLGFTDGDDRVAAAMARVKSSEPQTSLTAETRVPIGMPVAIGIASRRLSKGWLSCSL